MGRRQLQREEDQTAISCERYEASNYKGNPMLLPCSRVEEDRDSKRRDRAWRLGGELPPHLALLTGS